MIGRQEDRTTADRLAADFPLGFDIIIDDGGHVSAAQIASLELLFPLVRGGAGTSSRIFTQVIGCATEAGGPARSSNT